MRATSTGIDRLYVTVSTTMGIHIGLAGMLLLISGCGKPVGLNKQLEQWTPEHPEQTQAQIVGNRSTDQLVMLAFSGGGTRAAAFSYGVLQELAATQVQGPRGTQPLLDEVDMISSVSGGSFTSAYYGLRGNRIFEDYEERFLRKNVESDLLWLCARPDNAVKLMSSTFGKADIADKYYNKHVFEGASMADLRRPNAPLVAINATDLATGFRIVFDHSHFDLLCADLDSYRLSRAVAASSSVPVLFSPVLLENYAGTCGFKTTPLLEEALHDKRSTSRRSQAQEIVNYLDREKRPWLHLVDGGIADNLGLRAFYDAVSLVGDPQLAMKAMGHPEVRRILIISVNSHAHHDAKWPLKPNCPSIITMMNSISGVQIDRYSVDSIDMVNYAYQEWAKRLSTPTRPVTFDFVQVDFDKVKDPNEQEYLNMIGTNFHLENEKVDHLIAAARQVLRESPEFQRFLSRK
ncbi:patatin-like phospholipase family protein [Planctomycetota bacterium]